MSKGFTREEAIALAESKFWETMSLEDRGRSQLFQPLLCMPFDIYHEAVEKLLGRPVWTHEFADQIALQKEYLGEKEPPTMKQIISLIPEEKRIIVKTVGKEE